MYFVEKAEIVAALATRAPVDKRIEAIEWLFSTLNETLNESEPQYNAWISLREDRFTAGTDKSGIIRYEGRFMATFGFR